MNPALHEVLQVLNRTVNEKLLTTRNFVTHRQLILLLGNCHYCRKFGSVYSYDLEEVLVRQSRIDHLVQKAVPVSLCVELPNIAHYPGFPGHPGDVKL